jgi:hypothetical protein
MNNNSRALLTGYISANCDLIMVIYGMSSGRSLQMRMTKLFVTMTIIHDRCPNFAAIVYNAAAKDSTDTADACHPLLG